MGNLERTFPEAKYGGRPTSWYWEGFLAFKFQRIDVEERKSSTFFAKWVLANSTNPKGNVG